MKPRSLFRLFQSERKRLSAESRSGTLESIFYSDKHSSIQYRINSPEQSGVFTVVFSQDKNDLWWRVQSEEGSPKVKGLGVYLGCIEEYRKKDYVNVVFLRSDAMNQVPALISRLVNDYHTGRGKLGLYSESTDNHCIENIDDIAEQEE